MASKRVTGLMAILLILILGYVSRPFWDEMIEAISNPPLSGNNTVSGLKVHQDARGRWIADFDYFYTGAPRDARLEIWLKSEGESQDNDLGGYGLTIPPMIERGQHHVSVEIQRSPRKSEAHTSSQVVVEMVAFTPDPSKLNRKQIISEQTIDQSISWADWLTWIFVRQLAAKSSDEILKDAIALIDVGDERSLARAKQTLEWLMGKDPKFDAAYVELARVAMKTNWGPEGLHQAENLIQSALQIRPDSVNAKILLGYVYAHQKQYRQAEGLFAEAAMTDTKNLWLWSNWGEVLVMQNKLDQGIEKYREAVLRPRTNDTYDRARLDAYWHLITLLGQRNDLDGLEALYKQRADEYEAGNCYNADYARFILQQRGDSKKAIAFARKAVDGHCPNPEARETLGLANYVAWAEAAEEQRVELLNQAHVFLPIGPRPLYLLAASDKTVVALKRLIESGESIDQPDNDKWNALSHAIGAKDYKAISRLVRLGARLDAPAGPYQMPVAMLPVVEGDVDGIRLMRKLGTNYLKLQYQGVSVFDQVRRSGNRKLIEEVNPKANAL